MRKRKIGNYLILLIFFGLQQFVLSMDEASFRNLVDLRLNSIDITLNRILDEIKMLKNENAESKIREENILDKIEHQRLSGDQRLSEIKSKLVEVENNFNDNYSQLKNSIQEKIEILEEKPIFTIGKDLQSFFIAKNHSNFNDTMESILESVETFKGNQEAISKQILDLGIVNKNDFEIQTNNITEQFYELTFNVGGLPGKFAGFWKIPRKEDWIVIQRRGIFQEKPRTSFEKNFTEYEKGFGDYENDFWIGLEKIRALTFSGYTDIKFVITDWEGTQKYADYKNFTIGDKYNNFRLNVGNYSGTAGDSFTSLNGEQFSTFDSDNDSWRSGSCSVEYGRGGWWFPNSCRWSNLNGQYFTGTEINTQEGIRWHSWKNTDDYSFKSSEMMLKIPKV